MMQKPTTEKAPSTHLVQAEPTVGWGMGHIRAHLAVYPQPLKSPRSGKRIKVIMEVLNIY